MTVHYDEEFDDTAFCGSEGPAPMFFTGNKSLVTCFQCFNLLKVLEPKMCEYHGVIETLDQRVDHCHICGRIGGH